MNVNDLHFWNITCSLFHCGATGPLKDYKLFTPIIMYFGAISDCLLSNVQIEPILQMLDKFILFENNYHKRVLAFCYI